MGGGSRLLKREYEKTLSWDPSFIAALLDSGYTVTRGDIVPVLCIRKASLPGR
jgi:hypothetical protein